MLQPLFVPTPVWYEDSLTPAEHQQPDWLSLSSYDPSKMCPAAQMPSTLLPNQNLQFVWYFNLVLKEWSHKFERTSPREYQLDAIPHRHKELPHYLEGKFSHYIRDWHRYRRRTSRLNLHNCGSGALTQRRWCTRPSEEYRLKSDHQFSHFWSHHNSFRNQNCEVSWVVISAWTSTVSPPVILTKQYQL